MPLGGTVYLTVGPTPNTSQYTFAVLVYSKRHCMLHGSTAWAGDKGRCTVMCVTSGKDENG